MRRMIAFTTVVLVLGSTAFAGPPELSPLNELPQDGYSSAPWVSPDGLTLYWQYTPKGERQRWVWRADRKSPGGLFENPRKIIPGSDPTLTGDGLEIIVLQGQDLLSARRKTTQDDFGRPGKIPELSGQGFLASPCLSEDGLLLWVDHIEKDKLEIMRFSRPSRDAEWGQPQRVKSPLIGSTGRFLFVSPKRGYGFCSVPELLKDKSANNLVYFTAKDEGSTFTKPVVVELAKEVVRGKSPRYVEATRELLFAGDLEADGRSRLFVIRNFDLSALANK